MKKCLIVLLVVAGFHIAQAQAQNSNICQPDSAIIYYDISVHPDWYYGGVWNFQCSYDSSGLLSQMKVDAYQGESCVVRDHQYEYDQNHNVICTDYVGYDCEAPRADVSKEVCSYQDNLLITQASYSMTYGNIRSGEQSWICTDSAVFQYDGLSRLVSKKSYNSNHVHVVTLHLEYYDNVVNIITERLQDGVWGITQRVTKEYSDDGLLLSTLNETCDNGVYSNNTLESCSYDNLNHCTSILTQKWNNDQWENVKFIDNVYDYAGFRTASELKEWQDGAFVSTHRALYELNDAGYPTMVTFEQWGDDKWEEGTWRPEFYVFAEDYLQRQNQEICNIDVKRIEIHYSITPLPDYDVDENQTEKAFCEIHPNPAKSSFIITGKCLKQAEVVNMLGQHVAKAQGEGERLTVDISSLPAGIYFVNITDSEGRKCVRKVVKE